MSAVRTRSSTAVLLIALDISCLRCVPKPALFLASMLLGSDCMSDMLLAQNEHLKHAPCQSCCCEIDNFAERNLCRPRVITYRGVGRNLSFFVAEEGTRYRELTTLEKRATYAALYTYNLHPCTLFFTASRWKAPSVWWFRLRRLNSDVTPYIHGTGAVRRRCHTSSLNSWSSSYMLSAISSFRR